MKIACLYCKVVIACLYLGNIFLIIIITLLQFIIELYCLVLLWYCIWLCLSRVGVLVLFVSPNEHVGQAGLARPCPAQQHQPGTRVPTHKNTGIVNNWQERRGAGFDAGIFHSDSAQGGRVNCVGLTV